MKLRGLVLNFAGLYLERMEVSVNFLIIPGLSFKDLPCFNRTSTGPHHKVQPAFLQLSISYLLQSTPFLTR